MIAFFLLAAVAISGPRARAEEPVSKSGQNRVVLTLKGAPESSEKLRKKIGADYVGPARIGPRLSVQERDEMFLRSGFTNEELKSLDHMERDLLIRNLKFGSWEFTKKKYARFAEAKLQALKKLADANKNLVWK